MIINDSIIHRKILKQTIIEQLIRINHILLIKDQVIGQIQSLTFQKIPLKVKQLQKTRIFTQKKSLQNKSNLESLKHQLSIKQTQKHQRLHQTQSLMRQLKQNCSQIRQLNKKILKQRNQNNQKLTNELQQYEIVFNENDQIYQGLVKKKENQLIKIKQLGNNKREENIKIQKRKKEIRKMNEKIEQDRNIIRQYESKQNKLIQQLSQIKLNQQQQTKLINNIPLQISQLQLLLLSQKTTLQVLSTRFYELSLQFDQKHQQLRRLKQISTLKQPNLFQKIEDLNKFNDNIIKIRKQTIQVNKKKNQQKVRNVKLKNKVRQLMRQIVNK